MNIMKCEKACLFIMLSTAHHCIGEQPCWLVNTPSDSKLVVWWCGRNSMIRYLNQSCLSFCNSDFFKLFQGGGGGGGVKYCRE